jgi:hypothetical protein
MPILVEGSSSNASRGQAKEKRGGYRSIIAYRVAERSVFLYGFSKNERDNIDGDELARWKDRWSRHPRGRCRLDRVCHCRRPPNGGVTMTKRLPAVPANGGTARNG